jgi:hypothetical protein
LPKKSRKSRFNAQEEIECLNVENDLREAKNKEDTLKTVMMSLRETLDDLQKLEQNKIYYETLREWQSEEYEERSYSMKRMSDELLNQVLTMMLNLSHIDRQ